MEQIDLFRKELDTIGVSCALENENIYLEYSFEAVDQKKVNRLLNQYVGFWRSIGIKTDHSKDNKIARYIIPVDWIGAGDLTDDQVLDAAEYIRQRLGNVSMSQIDDMKHAVGYKPSKVKDGRYYAFRNFFAIDKEQPGWEDLVVRGLATKRKQFNETVYHVSEEGFKILSSVLSVEVLPEPEE